MKQVRMFRRLKEEMTPSKERGRSMVEMLGVLAIIGVLSIGAVAGYTIAINRYKAMRILDISSKLSVAVQSRTPLINPTSTWNEHLYIAQLAGEVYEEYGIDAVGNVGSMAEYETTFIVDANWSVNVYGSPPGIRRALGAVLGGDFSTGPILVVKVNKN